MGKTPYFNHSFTEVLFILNPSVFPFILFFCYNFSFLNNFVCTLKQSYNRKATNHVVLNFLDLIMI